MQECRERYMCLGVGLCGSWGREELMVTVRAEDGGGHNAKVASDTVIGTG